MSRKCTINPNSKEHGGGNGYGATQEPVVELGEAAHQSDGEASDKAIAKANGSSTVCKNISADTNGYKNGVNGSSETALLPTKKGEPKGTSSTMWAVISTVHTASFFSAVVLSGMGAGVIDTFLFIR